MQSSSVLEVAVYTKRWAILAAFCSLNIFVNFASQSFAVANQIYSEYYNTNFSLLDWLSLGMYAGLVLAAPVIAWLIFKQTIGFRVLLITATCSLLVTYLVIIVSVVLPYLYPLMIVSNLLQGVAYIVSVTVGPSFAVVWFPNHQVGLVIAIDLLCHNVGVIFGSILPPVFLKHPPAYFGNNSISEITSPQQDSWRNEIRITSLYFYIPCAVVLFALILFFIAFMKDQPLKPPTHAMLVKRITSQSTKPSTDFSQFLTAVKCLHQDVNFVLCIFTLNPIYSLMVVFFLHITAIVDYFQIRNMGINMSNDIFAGLLISALSMSNVIFGFVSAELSRKWKSYVKQAIIGAILTTIALLSVVLSAYYHMFKLFCVSMFFYGVGSRIFVIPLLEIITRHTYPIDEAFVNVWMGVNQGVVIVIIAELARIISVHTGIIGLLIFVCVSAFISFILTLMLNPRDKRREIDSLHEEQDGSVVEESSPLLFTEQSGP